MANLRTARKNIFAAMIVLAVVDVIAVFILISPAGATPNANRLEQFRALRLQVQNKMRTVVPPDQVQQRVVEARTQIGDFIDQRIPVQASAVPVELGKVAGDAGVQLSSVRYSETVSDIPGVEQVGISATISGSYLQIVKFINALERDKTFFVINSVTLAEEQGGSLRLGLILDAYLRGQP